VKKTNQAFWLTVIPTVLLWNFLRPWLLRQIFGGEPRTLATTPDLLPWSVANIAISCGLAAVAGYAAAVWAAPRELRAATNAAIGVTLVFGLQNIIEYREIGFPAPYFVIVPLAAGGAAVLGGTARALQRWKKP
jgi:hypothetical protein